MNRRAEAARLRAEAYERLAEAERIEADVLEAEPGAAAPPPAPARKRRRVPPAGPVPSEFERAQARSVLRQAGYARRGAA